MTDNLEKNITNLANCFKCYYEKDKKIISATNNIGEIRIIHTRRITLENIYEYYKILNDLFRLHEILTHIGIIKVYYQINIIFIDFINGGKLWYSFQDCKIIKIHYRYGSIYDEYKTYKELDDLVNDNEEFHFARRIEKIAQHE